MYKGLCRVPPARCSAASLGDTATSNVLLGTASFCSLLLLCPFLFGGCQGALAGPAASSCAAAPLPSGSLRLPSCIKHLPAPEIPAAGGPVKGAAGGHKNPRVNLWPLVPANFPVPPESSSAAVPALPGDDIWLRLNGSARLQQPPLPCPRGRL